MNVFRAVSTDPTNHHLLAFLLPLEDGPGPDAEPAPNLGGNGDLALGGQLRLSDRHGPYITMVLKTEQDSGIP